MHTNGSSPLTRGKLIAGDRCRVRVRLIPAHAGKTSAQKPKSQRARAHPRSRGENSAHQQDTARETGSSPLTRGKRDDAERARDVARLIPAHAGKTWCSTGGLSGWWAHPRSRRENGRDPVEASQWVGSSPLTRGKPGFVARRRPRLRLIPAHAGKTRCLLRRLSRARAHPRSRGENDRDDINGATASGSSPLTRGKQALLVGQQDVAGLIPAHAGKTRQSSRNARQRAAHPRSRGENAQCGEHVHGEAGSSPLTRGKRDPAVRRRRAGRLIPAHAGKTRRPTGYGRDCEAHPRSRGENRMACHSGQSGVGSSPLTRGKHADLS